METQFGWDVIEHPVFLGNGEKAKGYKALTRSDNSEILNVCKDSYTPTSNERLMEFVDNVSRTTGYSIQSVDEFTGGRKVLAFLKAEDSNLVGYGFQNYMVVGNAHDATNAFFVGATNIMMRCSNQFTLLSRKALRAIHNNANEARVQDIESSIGGYAELVQNLNSNYEYLMNNKIDERRKFNFIWNMFDIQPKDMDIKALLTETPVRTLNRIEELTDCVNVEIQDIGNNEFALFNGVTRWTTHHREKTAKTFGNVFGSNAILNNKAMNLLLKAN